MNDKEICVSEDDLKIEYECQDYGILVRTDNSFKCVECQEYGLANCLRCDFRIKRQQKAPQCLECLSDQYSLIQGLCIDSTQQCTKT